MIVMAIRSYTVFFGITFSRCFRRTQTHAINAALLLRVIIRRELGHSDQIIKSEHGGTDRLATAAELFGTSLLRHACGYALAKAGHDTRAIQDWLGHRSIQHTVRYTELSPTRFKNFWRD